MIDLKSSKIEELYLFVIIINVITNVVFLFSKIGLIIILQSYILIVGVVFDLSFLVSLFYLVWVAGQFPNTKNLILSIYFMITINFFYSILIKINFTPHLYVDSIFGLFLFTSSILFVLQIIKLKSEDIFKDYRTIGYIFIGVPFLKILLVYILSQPHLTKYLTITSVLDIFPVFSILILGIKRVSKSITNP